ncbi:ABC transporter permease [Teredinibacter turnerae]|uniref:ABC transporter permease n=1 Tax=Teredinibacter turnerae TaxID=2426 RepID=UPI0005F78E55|nr:ABC transporter permease [Teredinibacter turnerae]
MKQILTVALKEIKDNIRDRRAFFFALIYGPVLMPLLMVGPILFSAKNNVIDFDATSDLYVVGAEQAPNLIQMLLQNNLVAKPAPPNFREKLRSGELAVVLEISDIYGERLREGKPAPLFVYVNHSSKDSLKAANQLKSVLSRYSAELGYWRLNARGLSADLSTPIKLVEEDVSSQGISGMLFGFMVYFLIMFTMMTGGFYLAVDITAGERERNSLEPLLSLPIARWRLVAGKYLAILGFVGTSASLAVACVYLIFTLVPMDDLHIVLNLSGTALVQSYLVALPCIFFVAALLLATSAYTRTPKEAQTYISVLYLLPMAPILVKQLSDVAMSGPLLALPYLGQFSLIDRIIKAESFSLAELSFSVGGTLLCAVVLIAVALSLYKREQILRD